MTPWAKLWYILQNSRFFIPVSLAAKVMRYWKGKWFRWYSYLAGYKTCYIPRNRSVLSLCLRSASGFALDSSSTQLIFPDGCNVSNIRLGIGIQQSYTMFINYSNLSGYSYTSMLHSWCWQVALVNYFADHLCLHGKTKTDCLPLWKIEFLASLRSWIYNVADTITISLVQVLLY